jgi:DNA primase
MKKTSLNTDNLRYLFEYVKQKADLSEYLETEIGCSIKWSQPGISGKTKCPLPDHKEKLPSFHIKRQDDGVWVYYCFGCQEKGTIIDFCQKYHGLPNVFESVTFLCKKFGFENVSQFKLDSFKDVKKKFDIKKKTECVHIEVANQCRRLLRKDFKKHNAWVSAAYKKLNKALNNSDLSAVEKIGYEACNKMGEK